MCGRKLGRQRPQTRSGREQESQRSKKAAGCALMAGRWATGRNDLSPTKVAAISAGGPVLHPGREAVDG